MFAPVHTHPQRRCSLNAAATICNDLVGKLNTAKVTEFAKSVALRDVTHYLGWTVQELLANLDKNFPSPKV